MNWLRRYSPRQWLLAIVITSLAWAWLPPVAAGYHVGHCSVWAGDTKTVTRLGVQFCR